MRDGKRCPFRQKTFRERCVSLNVGLRQNRSVRFWGRGEEKTRNETDGSLVQRKDRVAGGRHVAPVMLFGAVRNRNGMMLFPNSCPPQIITAQGEHASDESRQKIEDFCDPTAPRPGVDGIKSGADLFGSFGFQVRGEAGFARGLSGDQPAVSLLAQQSVGHFGGIGFQCDRCVGGIMAMQLLPGTIPQRIIEGCFCFSVDVEGRGADVSTAARCCLTPKSR